MQNVVENLVSSGTLEAHPTFFECATAIAFELFRRARVDVAVLEVGLGGRLDATNVVTPVAAAITSIALDHQAQLGTTIAAVAREKAGVIKRGIPVVCGPVPEEADQVISETCRERHARLIRTADRVATTVELTAKGTRVSLHTARHHFDGVQLALQGRHQTVNAATAVTLLEELDNLGVSVAPRAIRAGLTDTRWPGRLEQFHLGSTEVLLDAAHNPAGADALAAYITDAGWSDATLVFGAMRDKDAAGMLTPLCRSVRRLICTTAPGARAATASELAPSEDSRGASPASALPARRTRSAANDAVATTASAFAPWISPRYGESVIEKPSTTCSTTSPSVIAAHIVVPRTRTKRETTSSATAMSGMRTPPTTPWMRNPTSPTPAAWKLSSSALSTTPPSDTRLSMPPNANAIAAAWTTTAPATVHARPV